MKQQACQAVGFTSSVVELGAETSQDALSRKINQHTTDASVDEHINPQMAIGAIGAAKDVDGLHPTNVGASVLGFKGGFLPCTPAGVLQALQRSRISLEGQHVVVVGRSKLVGLPLANMLIGGRDSAKGGRKGPTVTVVHSGTVDIHVHTRMADIVIVAAGHAGLITADSVKQGVVLVDVGINHVPDSSRKSGYRLVGDCTDEAYRKASRYTPVPGGIGPMTVAMLMRNTWEAAKRHDM
ncbi:methenyltetrahydrofolate cyclohydrolase [Acanthamoeba castellanii str. Neff]|uniref:Methenyltetrahydrofolate cyclohydrolase n=1 Tax=Acanthamoeba castellanii (strain ATCC 30010 / Neff) TaxID=1257118 RepID=L8HK58_ACACF|nr:methenyltetrahydrofolate cyclohydrolase [Acanthamoeba castellanii str. Neff]ELR25580.1 methenyltetrahydrofolate cyclohydrolase [Acanthamoeba castellanii str. Neff]